MEETTQELDSTEAVANGLTETTRDDPRVSEPLSESTEPVKQGPVRRASGPRSQAGKTRSSRNSLKHGIFAYAKCLRGEHHNEYTSLLEAFRKDLKPKDVVQESLVEKLAINIWRHRRLLIAESADSEKRAALKHFDRWVRKKEEAEGPSRPICFGEVGVVTEIRNPQALKYTLDLLANFRKRIESDGFNEAEDMRILEVLYASSPEWSDLGQNLRAVYLDYFSEAARNQEGHLPPEEYKRAFLVEIDREIGTLKRNAMRYRLLDPDQVKTDALEDALLDPEVLDRFMRYEASLDRSYERTLALLLRLQEIDRDRALLPVISRGDSES